MSLLVGRSGSLGGLELRSSDIGTLLGLLGALGQAIYLVLAVLLNELSKILDGARAGVLDGLVLLTGGVELDGGEPSNGVGHIVGSGVNLSNHNLVGGVAVQSGELFILGSKTKRPNLAYTSDDGQEMNLRLAVSAPGGVELNKNILLVVDDDLLVVTAHDDGDGAFLGLGDGLGLDARLNLAVEDILDELADLLGVDLLRLVIGVLGVLSGLLDGEGRELLGLEVQVASVGAEELSVKSHDVDGSAVFLGDGAEVLSELLALLGSLSEDICQRDTGLLRECMLAFSSESAAEGFPLRTAMYLE